MNKDSVFNMKKDELLEELINELLDQKLEEYDDTVRQIEKSIGSTRNAYISDLKGIVTTIEDLLTQLPNRDNIVHIVKGKVQ